jgi:UDP-4-amino-4,6-dideoxy-N-acetyl-beta-L-altrosamine transaminase/dTDP-4-dehydrorhamnose reductase
VSGLLGNNLAYYFKDKYEVLGLHSSHAVTIKGIYTEKCDLSFNNSIRKIIRDFNPSVIIHCASLTNVDQCEVDKNLTKKINVLSTKNIVEDITDRDVKLVYISTDSVYDGVKGDFSEDDNVNPLNYYGLSKYEGEVEVLKKKNSLVLRTNIFGWNIQNKLSLGEWILEELKAGRKINCFKDAYFSTIYTLELARVIDIAIQNNLSGIYNCGGTNSCSKYEFAHKIASCFGFDKTFIAPIFIDDFGFKAKRGKKLTLNVNKLQKELDYKLPTIEQSIESFYKDYKCGLPDMIKKGQSASREEFNFIPYGRHWIDENDIQAVASVLRSDRITQGPKVEEFEKALTEYTGARYAVVVSSGTAALHIACLAAGVKEGDEVITSPITFTASANCILYCGGKPVFADIDKGTYNIDPTEIEKKITSRTKAIIPVHFAGQSCDMESIHKIVIEAEKKYGHKIYIIEDACHALGSLYKKNKVGSCKFSHMTVMSFHPVKHITTGEGGIVLTNDKELYSRLKRLRSHGITSNPEEFVYRHYAFQSNGMLNPWYYEQIDLGYNYRITDIQCALGLSQMKNLDDFRRLRKTIVNRYNKAFGGIRYIQTPYESTDCESNFHLYVILFDFEAIGRGRTEFMLELKRREIQTQVHYIPVYTQPFYRKTFGTDWGDCPNAEAYYKRCLSIPLFPAMTENDVENVITEIKELVESSKRSKFI